MKGKRSGVSIRTRSVLVLSLAIVLVGCVTGPGGVQVGYWKGFDQEAIALDSEFAALPIAITVPVAVSNQDVYRQAYNQGKFANYIKPGFIACNSGPVIHEDALFDAVSSSIYFSEYAYRVLSRLDNPIMLQPYELEVSEDGRLQRRFIAPTTPAAITVDYFTYVNPSHVYACATTFGNLVTPILNVRTWESISPQTGGLLVSDRTTSQTGRSVESNGPVGSGYTGDIVGLVQSNASGTIDANLNTDQLRKKKLPLASNRVVLLPAGWLWVNFRGDSGDGSCGTVENIERGHDTFLLAAVSDALRVAGNGGAMDAASTRYGRILADMGPQTVSAQAGIIPKLYEAEVKLRSYGTSRFYDSYRRSQACIARRTYIEQTRKVSGNMFSASMRNAAMAGASSSSMASAMITAGNQDRVDEADMGQQFVDSSAELMGVLRNVEVELSVGNEKILASSLDDLREKMVERFLK